MASERKISGRTIYEGAILTLQVDEIRLENGKTATREVIDHNGACGVIAIDEEDNLILVRQHRYPIDQSLLEIPAGKLDAGEAPLDCARRELREETGLSAAVLEPLGTMYPAAAYDRELVHLYWAKGLTAGEQSLDPDEFLTVEKLPFAEALEQVMAGEIPDSKTQIAILKVARLRETVER